MYEYIESSLLSKWTPASFHVELPVARKKIVRSIVKANGSSLHDEQESRTERGTAVRFAYTLIQPWSLGLVCKCVAIFRPVSRLYNTFVRSDPLPLDTRGRRCVRAYLVHAQPARADTYTCVRCNCRTRQTGYPRGSSTPTPHRDTDSNTKRGPFAYRPDRNTALLSFVLDLSSSRFLTATTRGYARSNHARCRGYTPIEPCHGYGELIRISSIGRRRIMKVVRAAMPDVGCWGLAENWFRSEVILVNGLVDIRKIIIGGFQRRGEFLWLEEIR